MHVTSVLLVSLISSSAMALPKFIMPGVIIPEDYNATKGRHKAPTRVDEYVSAPMADTPFTGSNGAAITKREADSDVCAEGWAVAATSEVFVQFITGGGSNARYDAVMKNHCGNRKGPSSCLDREPRNTFADKLGRKIFGKLWDCL